ncbi:hypothetical protein RA231_000257 [Cronobacter turicensis]|nr:hypothetical protein [Cronobacter turicensis]EKY1992375.1 hypothetical protein [Cronobacter turicensis]
MSFDVLVFGDGFDGELISIENFQNEIAIKPRSILQLSGSSSSTYQRMSTDKKLSFKLKKHKNDIDGKTYLVAIANGCAVNDIDLKISWQCPRPFVEK